MYLNQDTFNLDKTHRLFTCDYEADLECLSCGQTSTIYLSSKESYTKTLSFYYEEVEKFIKRKKYNTLTFKFNSYFECCPNSLCIENEKLKKNLENFSFEDTFNFGNIPNSKK